MNRTILLSHQPIIVRWNILTWKSSWPSRNGTGHFLLLNMNYVSRSIDISMEMLITLCAVEELTSFHFGSCGFIRNSDTNLTTLMAGLRCPCRTDCPHTSIIMTHAPTHVTNSFEDFWKEVSGKIPREVLEARRSRIVLQILEDNCLDLTFLVTLQLGSLGWLLFLC